ncbi:unnamed protein product [Trypanosoma congolense IL3000]|uniref:WGS project CAEQ00000000 data, annotated contig 350 n=1 Tax=Trypanosoma congolense (strain IL3000) TaxID=1068625 RepID=F9WF47_TRYCI|nr:unnamed protein product [Trypanosoma congolense IL3000]
MCFLGEVWPLNSLPIQFVCLASFIAHGFLYRVLPPLFSSSTQYHSPCNEALYIAPCAFEPCLAAPYFRSVFIVAVTGFSNAPLILHILPCFPILLIGLPNGHYSSRILPFAPKGSDTPDGIASVVSAHSPNTSVHCIRTSGLRYFRHHWPPPSQTLWLTGHLRLLRHPFLLYFPITHVAPQHSINLLLLRPLKGFHCHSVSSMC